MRGTLGLAGIANIINHPAVPSAVLSGNTERGGGLRQRDFSFKKPARGKIRNDLRNEKNFQ